MKTIVFLILITLSIPLYAQTNSPVATNAQPLVVTNANQALGAFIHYEAPSIDFEDSVKLAGSLMAIVLVGARYLRKIIPDSWQVNKAGLMLAHVAGEINPTMLNLAAEAAKEALAKPTPTILTPKL